MKFRDYGLRVGIKLEFFNFAINFNIPTSKTKGLRSHVTLLRCSCDYFKSSRKMRGITCVKTLMGTSRKEGVVNVTCWELKFDLFKVLMLPTFTYDTKFCEGNLKNSHWKALRRA